MDTAELEVIKGKLQNHTLVNDTTYCGEQGLEWYSKLVLIGGAREFFSQLTNVKDRRKIPNMEVSNVLQSGSCDPDYSIGTTTMDEKFIETKWLDIAFSFCPEEDFGDTFLAVMLRGTMLDQELPASFEAYLLELIQTRVSAQLSYLTWQGDTEGSPIGLVDGLLKEMAADAEIIDSTGAVLTTSNILAQLQLAYLLSPNTLEANGKTASVIMNGTTAKLYRLALVNISNGLAGVFNSDNVQLTYMQMPIVIDNGLPNDNIVIGVMENFWQASNLLNEEKTIKVERKGAGSKKVLVSGSFRIGWSYAVGAEIVWHRP